MPLVIIRHHKQKILDALTCTEDQREDQYKAFIADIYLALKKGLVDKLGVDEAEIAMEAPEYPAINGNRFPIETGIECTWTRAWGTPSQTKKRSRQLAARAQGVLAKWQSEAKANFSGWQTSVDTKFLGAFVASDAVPALNAE